MSKMRDLAVGRGGEVFLFDPDFLKEYDGYNIRDYEAEDTQTHIRKMANAIKENGIANFSPISVQKDGDDVYVVAGHLRKRAFSLAKSEGAPIKGIPCVVTTLNEQDRTLDLISSNDGLPLSPLQKATVVDRLIKFGWTTAEIAKKMGVSHAAVNNLLILLSAPTEIKEMVKEGLVSATLATETIQERGPEEAKKDITKAAEGGKRVTAKSLPSKIKKVTVMKSEGIGKFQVQRDKFELDSTEGDFPCSMCLHRKDYEECRTCGHFIDTEATKDDE